jgi:ATP-binding cassette subfamily B protein
LPDRPPVSWVAEVEAILAPGESVIAWLETDLDERPAFAAGLVVLTEARVFRLDARSKLTGSWDLGSIRTTRLREMNGLAHLELVGATGRLGAVSFTPGQVEPARRLAAAIDRARKGQAPPEAPARPGPMDDADETASPIRLASLLRLGRFARRHVGMLVLGGILTLATTAAGLVPPYLTMPLLDDVLVPYQNEVAAVDAQKDLTPIEREVARERVRTANLERFNRVPWLLGGLAGAALAAWVLGWAQGYVLARVSERITADMRNDTYAHLHTMSLGFFGGRRTGDLITRLSADTERICTFLADVLADFVADALLLLGTAIVLFSIDPVLAVATLGAFPPIAWVVYRAREHLGHGFRRGGKAWSEMSSVLADTLPGIRVVKAFAQEKREIERFRLANDRIVAANDRVNATWTFFWPMVVMLNQAGLLVVWAVGAWRVYDLRITVGVLTAFLAYITRFYTRLESMSRIVSATQRAATSAGRVFEILDREPGVPEPSHPKRLDHPTGAITMTGVQFSYGERTVLDGIDLDVKPGEMIGLVGPSGSGKSTLINLIARFHDVTAGSICVDGVDVRELELTSLRRSLGVVLQDPFLFYGTIAENIAYGRPEASHREIVTAARRARAHEFILRLPEGYDTHVGERGQALSGGERQRISIARALLVDPAILILDEATSAVDTETERAIQEALEGLIRGRTTIAIAHRLSTLRKADRLVVLENGKIVEVGPPAELASRRGGAFARLQSAQLELTRATPEGPA